MQGTCVKFGPQDQKLPPGLGAVGLDAARKVTAHRRPSAGCYFRTSKCDHGAPRDAYSVYPGDVRGKIGADVTLTAGRWTRVSQKASGAAEAAWMGTHASPGQSLIRESRGRFMDFVKQVFAMRGRAVRSL